jgi:flavodoxin
MKVLNLYFTTSGNTEKVAFLIRDTVQQLGHDVDTLKITGKDMEERVKGIFRI